MGEGPLDPARAIPDLQPGSRSARRRAHSRAGAPRRQALKRSARRSRSTCTSPTSASRGDCPSRHLGWKRHFSLWTLGHVAPEQIEGRGSRCAGGRLLARLSSVRVPDRDAPYPRDSELAVLWAHLNDPPPPPAPPGEGDGEGTGEAAGGALRHVRPSSSRPLARRWGSAEAGATASCSSWLAWVQSSLRARSQPASCSRWATADR